ncbi:MAG: sn-glycerol-3-phosphate ABC transporter ATP-binding protein UgpC [Paracoccaceae bacterium]|nr:sn-glycerol-3-phosphate ABC transporter ATP-binding protein UgpC [Paracoccaceae bacterium]
MSTVRLSNVSKSFGNLRVVSDVNLEISDGEFLVLLGPSGCGKSTTLRMIAGLEETSSGDILIDEKVINDDDPKDRNIAMVFQNYALYPHMSVRKNLAFGLKMRNMKTSTIAEKVNEVADMLQLSDLMERFPAQLSGGQRQRVAMGRAMVRTPKVFLFDEPLSNLDAVLRTELRSELKKLHMQLKTTSIYVTHDQVEAMTLADRIVVMKNGKIEQIGTPKEIFHNPKTLYVAKFIGNPQMNLHEMQVKKINNSIFLTASSLSIPIPKAVINRTNTSYLKDGATISMGIRPTDIFINNAGNKKGAFKAKMILTEMLGAETLIEFGIEDLNFKAIVEDDYGISSGDLFEVGMNFEKIHIFEDTT